MRASRGFTIAEVLTVLVIVGLLLSAIAVAMPLILKGPIEAQSQVDNVQSAAIALYKIQRDVRQSNINGVWVCTMPPIPSCSQPAPAASNPPIQAVAVVSAIDANGQFHNNPLGLEPAWNGMVLYWLTPNASGTSNELERIYYPVTIPTIAGIPDSTQLAVVTSVALTAVLGLGGYTTVAQDVNSISVAVDRPNNIVDLQVVGGATSGNKSSLTLTSNSYVRN